MTQELKDLITARATAVQDVYHRHGPVFRAAWLLAAILVILAGLAMTVLPGPAILVIPLGIAMLAARFRWAQWLLRVTIDWGVTFQRRMSRARPWVKVAVTTSAIAVGAIALRALLDGPR